MKYLQSIRAGRCDPKGLEMLYQSACSEHGEAEFKADLQIAYEELPQNMLFEAWYYRLLRPAPATAATEARAVNWQLAVPLSLVLAVIFAILSSSRFDFADRMPALVLVGAPIGACLVIVFLALAGGRRWQRALVPLAGVAVLGLYAVLFATLGQRTAYRDLMALHLPALGWIAIALAVLGWSSDARMRAGFIIKSIETVVTAGLYMLAGGAFAAITLGMFNALALRIPDVVTRAAFAAGAGAIIVLAVATVYDPTVGPLAQRFEQGVGRLIPMVTRLLLPLTLLLLVVYCFVIPFNFMEPFRNRGLLIAYNALLFFVMALLIGVTPVREGDLPSAYHGPLRAVVLAVAALTVLISLYALSAVVYRTAMGGLTVNRLAVIGWNGINIAVLALLIYELLRSIPSAWARAVHGAYRSGSYAYVAWTLILIVVTPWVFA